MSLAEGAILSVATPICESECTGSARGNGQCDLPYVCVLAFDALTKKRLSLFHQLCVVMSCACHVCVCVCVFISFFSSS